MSKSTAPSLVEQLQWRYAVKKFDATKKIPDSEWKALEQSLVLAPSSFGLQPWKFLVVTDKELRQKLTPVSWNQTQVADCSHFVVFLVKNELVPGDVQKLIDRMVHVRKTPKEALEGYKNVMLGHIAKLSPSDMRQWNTKQVYIALGQFMTAAAMLGIDTCPMEGLDAGKYDEILGLKDSGYSTVVACPAGYRASDDKYAEAAKIRYELGDLVQRI